MSSPGISSSTAPWISRLAEPRARLYPTHRQHSRNKLLENETIIERFSAPRRGAPTIIAAYPAPYRVGISNLGFHFLYSSLMESSNFNTERAFSDSSPVTLESGSRLSSMPVMLFSISYEEDYINLVRMLWGAGVAPLRSQREGMPLVIVGGPAVSSNPYPLADIADALAIGEGEGTLQGIIRVLEEQGIRGFERAGPREPETVLAALARIPGMLVPGYTSGGTRFNESAAIRRFPRSVIVTPESSFPDTLLVESGRGCPGACAFCVATSLYRPARFMRLAAFEELLAELSAPVARIGLVSTAVAANPDFPSIVRLIAANGMSVSFSSLRAEDIDEERARLIGGMGTASVSLAPESGSERVRFALGKRVSDEIYFNAASRLRAAGVAHFTLYLLIGCPGEDAALPSETTAFMERFKRAIGGRSFSVHANALVPKPWTPLEFYAMPGERELVARQHDLERMLRKLGLGVRIKSVRSAIRQALFSTGDERVGHAIVGYVSHGISWKKALKEAGVNERFPHETKGPETSFPWDAISGPVRRGTLFKRFEAIERGEPAGASP
jgi:radical SAM superfamily enzyme YgiQ (UPF0313 family)